MSPAARASTSPAHWRWPASTPSPSCPPPTPIPWSPRLRASGVAYRTRAGRRAPCGPTSPSPRPTAPRPSSTSQAPHSTRPRWTHSPGRSSATPKAPRGWCFPARSRLACPTTGTPTSSRSWPSAPCRVAVDTSERPLDALAAAFGDAAPDVIKPNAEELAGLVGASPAELEPLPPRVIRRRWWPPRTSSSNAGSRPCSSRSERPVPCWSTRPAAGWPPRRPSRRAAPSARATPRWRATSGPPSAAPNRRVACRWRSRTAAPRPRCPAPRYPSPSQIDLNAVRVYAITPASTRP